MNIICNIDLQLPVGKAPHGTFECCEHLFPYWTIRVRDHEFIVNEWSFADICLDEDGGAVNDEAQFYDERSPYAWNDEDSVKKCLEDFLEAMGEYIGLTDDSTVEVEFLTP